MEIEIFYPRITRKSDFDKPFLHFTGSALHINEAALTEMGIMTHSEAVKVLNQENEHRQELAQAEGKQASLLSINEVETTYLLWAKPAGNTDVVLLLKTVAGVGYKLQRSKGNAYLNVGKEPVSRYDLVKMGKFELDKEVTLDGKVWFRFKKMSQITMSGK